MTKQFPPIHPHSPLSCAEKSLGNFGGNGFAYDVVVESALVGVGFHVGRTLVWVNRTLAEMFGYSTSELIGQSVRMFYASREDYLEVGDQYGHLDNQDGYVHERRLRHRNGKDIWCLISGRRVSPDPDSPSVWIIQDITSRKNAENALLKSNERLEQLVEKRTKGLQELNRSLSDEVALRRTTELQLLVSREKYQAIFRNMSTGIVVTDVHGTIIEVNRAMHSYAGTQRLNEFMQAAAERGTVSSSSGEASSLLDFLKRAIPRTTRRSGRLQISWYREGNPLDLAVVASRLSAEGLGVAYTFEDISDQRLAREREQEQRQNIVHGGRLALMGQMASTLAHELGQPLNSSQSYLASARYRLKSELERRPDAQEALDMAERHLQQAGQIVHSVRSFITLKQSPRVEVDIPELLVKTMELIAPQLSSNHIRTIYDLPENRKLPSVLANPVEIQQVILNLVLNAIDAMQATSIADRRIFLRVFLRGDSSLATMIADNGSGISLKPAHKVFNDYITTKSNGLGMGLAISKSIIEAHGGLLELVKTQRCCGAAFRFTLQLDRKNS